MTAHPGARGHRFFILHDTSPFAGAATKGRSAVWAINFLLRRRAAFSLAADVRDIYPWVNSPFMPADTLSR